MSRAYTLDVKAATQAGVSNHITETGKYIGRFTAAVAKVSQQETEGIEFTFVEDDGRVANFLNTWTYKANGETLSGLKILSAIMACLRLREVKPVPGTYTKWDGTQARGDVFAELIGKPIGLLLQKELTTKKDGQDSYSFNIVAPFDAESELTAGEILSRATRPEQLAKMVATLSDRDSRGKGRNGNGKSNGGRSDYDESSWSRGEDEINF